MEVEIGQTFYRLTCVRRIESVGGGRRFRWTCECGGERDARISDVRSGRIKSCGCLRRENQRAIGKRGGGLRKRSSSSRVRQMHAFEIAQEPRGYWPGALEWARRAW